MASLITFPNAVCLALSCSLATHLLLGGGPPPTPPPDRPEDAYCCLVPRPRTRPACSSPASIFYACASPFVPPVVLAQAEQNRTEGAGDDSAAGEAKGPEEPGPEEDDGGGGGGGGRSPSAAEALVAAVLACSAAAGLREWCRERNRTAQGVRAEGRVGGGGGGAAVGGGSGDRRISLADLTFNRHLRRADHLNGTPTGSKGPPPLVRRSSFPAQPLPAEGRSRAAPRRQQSTPAPGATPAAPGRRRLSVDLDDDGSPDRRRVRFIRRH